MRKTCSRCAADKEFKEFYLQNNKPKAWCKVCDKAYNASYLKTKNGRNSRKNSDLKNLDKRLAMKRKYYPIRRAYERLSGQDLASSTVQRAIKNGIIFRKNICAVCFQETSTHFHHYNGYLKANHLDVVELCVPCHKEAHTEHDHQYYPRMG